MRILFLARSTDLPETNLIVRLGQAGARVECLLDPASPRFPALQAAGVGVGPLRLRSHMDREGIREIRGRLMESQVDVLHCLMNRPLANGLRAARKLPVKVVGYRGTVGNLGLLNPEAHLTYRHPRVDRIAAVSHAVRNYLLSTGIPDHKAVTIHKGHDPSWYQSAPPACLGGVRYSGRGRCGGVLG